MHQVISQAAAVLGAIAVLSTTLPTQAKELEAIQQVAETVTVQLNANNPGSGVIVGKIDQAYYQTYYVLTAKHVLETEKIYSIVTSDGYFHSIETCCIQKFEQVDLALVQFASDRNYPIATLAYPQPDREQFVFIYGFPAPGFDVSGYEWRFRSGKMLSPASALVFSESPFLNGYELFYDNVAEPGMSGGPVLDSDGRVIGIHGRSDGLRLYDESSAQMRRLRIGLSSGIPIQEFLKQAPSQVIASLNFDDAPPPRFSVEEAVIIQNHILASPVSLVRPQDPISLINYSNSLYRVGHLWDALASVDAAIQLNAALPDAWYFRGMILTKLNNHDLALSAFQQAIVLAPDYLLAWRQQARALVHLGQYIEALNTFDHALELQPQNYVNWYMRGELLREHLNQPEAAIESYRTALQLQPNFPQASQGLLLAVRALRSSD